MHYNIGEGFKPPVTTLKIYLTKEVSTISVYVVVSESWVKGQLYHLYH